MVPKIWPLTHSSSFMFQLEDLLHEMPLLGGGHGWVAALEAGDVGLPFGLAGQGGETGVVLDEVEVIGGVHDHEDTAFKAVNLHVEDADGADALLNLGPDVAVGVYIVLNHPVITDKVEGLAISFHFACGFIVSRARIASFRARDVLNMRLL